MFGVKYHLSQVARILHNIGWSVQKPVRVAAQQDEEAVREWKEEKWPTLKKVGSRRAHHLVCRREWLLLAAVGSQNMVSCRREAASSGVG
jgi:hypothetical protein